MCIRDRYSISPNPYEFLQAFQEALCIITFSYTHLDVYKRQLVLLAGIYFTSSKGNNRIRLTWQDSPLDLLQYGNWKFWAAMVGSLSLIHIS